MGHTINICKEHGRPQITCWDCKDAEITTLRARIAELEREKGDFLSLLLKAYSAMREPNGDWQNIKLNECMVSIREKLPTT